LLGVIAWAPKWPDQAWMWLLNNLLLVTLVEEALFRGYIQGGLSRCSSNLPYGKPRPAAGLTAVRPGACRCRLAMGVAGEHGRVGYGLAYRFGGLGAAIATHFGLNLLHLAVHLSDAGG
jgi:membrane protease YdiL (CAAX protease family)